MKVSGWTMRIVGCAAVFASGTCFAEVGIFDGEDGFKDFRSSKTRAEVQAEVGSARTQGTLSHGNTDMWTSGEAGMDIGAHGTAGSRYSSRSREDVQQELIEYRQTQKPYGPDYLYFGE